MWSHCWTFCSTVTKWSIACTVRGAMMVVDSIRKFLLVGLTVMDKSEMDGFMSRLETLHLIELPGD